LDEKKRTKEKSRQNNAAIAYPTRPRCFAGPPRLYQQNLIRFNLKKKSKCKPWLILGMKKHLTNVC